MRDMINLLHCGCDSVPLYRKSFVFWLIEDVAAERVTTRAQRASNAAGQCLQRQRGSGAVCLCQVASARARVRVQPWPADGGGLVVAVAVGVAAAAAPRPAAALPVASARARVRVQPWPADGGGWWSPSPSASPPPPPRAPPPRCRCRHLSNSYNCLPHYDGWATGAEGEEESTVGALRERELRSLHRTVPALRRRELDTRAIKHHFYPEGGWG
ncbi:hypothetical protein MSG28_013221 [Choristoneura fumiferana]|uniref:Uncharacterized protein n=1 Tax=Choristoneura fumiferana TaxID=7141 RepID=A0ACC0KT01_CHOFU|nr:hypothetical protein MSG28_013221 [Choristoneura fumiferana]